MKTEVIKINYEYDIGQNDYVFATEESARKYVESMDVNVQEAQDETLLDFEWIEVK